MKSARTLAIALVMTVVGAVPGLAATEITVEGGGWGHGIGMSQHGAKAMAESGKSAEQIMAHFYTGTAIGTVGTGALTGHADPLRIGVAQDQVNIGFEAIGGPVTACLGVNCLTAQPGDGLAWSIRSNGAGVCQFYNGETPVGISGSCNGSLTWTPQPAVRVSVPVLNRTYARGQILIAPAPAGRFHLLVEIGLEPYLYGLGEMPSSWHAEALQAQAIAGRTFALYKAWHYRNLLTDPALSARVDACSCHLYASTFDQKYIGWAKEAEGDAGFWGDKWRAAVNATVGKAVVHTSTSGRAIQSYYFSSSGGATENNEDVWGGSALAYLRSKADPGATSWTETIPKSTFASELGFDEVFSASITGKFVSGSPSSISVTGHDDGALQTKTFTGNDLRTFLGLRSHFITKIIGFLPSSFLGYVVGDFDGDDLDEVAAFSTNDGSWWVFGHSGGRLFGTEWASASRFGWQRVVSGDFNGDDKSDVAMFHGPTGAWWVGASNGSKLSFSRWADFSTASGWKTQVVGDFNGDGRDDIANFHPSNGTWWVSRSTGSGFSTSLWADFSTASGWQTQIAGDFNGDGRDDIANFHPSNGTWWVSRSTGSGFSTSLWANFSTASGWQTQIAGDFNGDGRDDIANFHPSNGTWWVSRSTGSGFSTSLWADYTTTSGWSPQLVGDFNNDGRDDIANFHSSNGRWWVSQSNGGSFSTHLRSTVSPPSGWKGQLVGDFTGDGQDDLSNYYPFNQTWWVR